MAKKTAVIDLGSNSVRMVVFEKTSRYGFFICSEHKKKVRLGKMPIIIIKSSKKKLCLKPRKLWLTLKKKL